MTIRMRGALRAIAGRIVIAAVASAVVVGMLPPNSLPLKVLETASIVQEPTTIGIADSNLYNQSQADVDRTLDTLQAMGVQNVRIVIPWAGVQPLDRPTYYWTNVDRMVNAAAERNMGVLAVLNSTPAWASDRYLSGHPDPNQFAQFAGLVADRYKGEIAAYEVWNEPNAITFWNPVDPVAYTHLLQAGYTAIKTEDPNAVVVGGVVASLFTAGNVTINPQDFIAQMYDAGAKGYFDAISFHPYHFSLEFSQGNNHPLSAEQQVQEMYQVMVNHGDGGLKIWATEYGMPTAEVNGQVVTEEQQAAFIDDFLHAWQKVDGAGPMFIYTFRDSYSGDPDIQKNFGIFYTDWTPKLAAQVIAQFAGGLVPERPNRPIIDAALAITRAIVNATSRLIHAGVQLFAAAVDVTVRFIAGLVDLGVRLVKGVVDTIGRVIDAITGRFRPDAAAAAKTATELPGPTALASNTSPPDNTTVTHKRGNSPKAETTIEPVATDTKPAVAKEDSNSDNKTTTGATKKAEPEPASVTPDKPTDTADTTSTPKTDPDPSTDANTTNVAKDDDATAPADQETKKPKKKQKSCSGCDGAG
jgi:polysaccharide biosynthesis protein PslG